MDRMEVNVVHVKSGKELAVISGLSSKSTILDVKKGFKSKSPKYYADRQSYKTDPRGKMVKDEDSLESLGITNGGKLYFKDLGPQVGWTTVFLTEYAGPLVIYLMFYTRPSLIYGEAAASQPMAQVVHVAAGCWTFHYAKRLLETVFVHRFSHATMPIMNIFRNSVYYWGFAAFVAYFVNHPLYTPPGYGDMQMYIGLGTFIFAELGNFSIHLLFKNLRPAGSKVRKIPRATANPFTWLFKLVSCPNYTYESLAWIGFTAMTQCLPAGLFCLAGSYQMLQWAMGKHRNYLREFKDYPRSRKSMIPFVL